MNTYSINRRYSHSGSSYSVAFALLLCSFVTGCNQPCCVGPTLKMSGGMHEWLSDGKMGLMVDSFDVDPTTFSDSPVPYFRVGFTVKNLTEDTVHVDHITVKYATADLALEAKKRTTGGFTTGDAMPFENDLRLPFDLDPMGTTPEESSGHFAFGRLKPRCTITCYSDGAVAAGPFDVSLGERLPIDAPSEPVPNSTDLPSEIPSGIGPDRTSAPTSGTTAGGGRPAADADVNVSDPGSDQASNPGSNEASNPGSNEATGPEFDDAVSGSGQARDAAARAEAGPWEPYRALSQGVRLDLPVGWAVSAIHRVGTSYVQCIAPQPHVTVFVEIADRASDSSPIMSARNMDRLFRAKYNERYRLRTIAADETLDSESAVRWEFDLQKKPRGIWMRKADIFCKHGSRGYALLCQAPRNTYPEWDPIFTRVRNSFQFLGQTEESPSASSGMSVPLEMVGPKPSMSKPPTTGSHQSGISETPADGPVVFAGVNNSGDLLLDSRESHPIYDCTITLSGGYKAHIGYFGEMDRVAIPDNAFKRDDGISLSIDSSDLPIIVSEECH